MPQHGASHGGTPVDASVGADWKRLVALSGEEGRAWLLAYQEPGLVALEQLGVEALHALRRGELELGRSSLAQLEAGLAARPGLPASIRHIHDRWYFGVLAYYEYAAGHHQRAEACLEAAYDAVCGAIEEEHFLILLANHCQEFRLHQARIARGRLHWQDVRRYIGEAARMIEDGQPLCVLPSGREIRLADMQAFCEALPRPAGTPPYLAELFDLARHRKQFENFVETIYMPPGYVLTYP